MKHSKSRTFHATPKPKKWTLIKKILKQIKEPLQKPSNSVKDMMEKLASITLILQTLSKSMGILGQILLVPILLVVSIILVIILFFSVFYEKFIEIVEFLFPYLKKYIQIIRYEAKFCLSKALIVSQETDKSVRKMLNFMQKLIEFLINRISNVNAHFDNPLKGKYTFIFILPWDILKWIVSVPALFIAMLLIILSAPTLLPLLVHLVRIKLFGNPLEVEQETHSKNVPQRGAPSEEYLSTSNSRDDKESEIILPYLDENKKDEPKDNNEKHISNHNQKDPSVKGEHMESLKNVILDSPENTSTSDGVRMKPLSTCGMCYVTFGYMPKNPTFGLKILNTFGSFFDKLEKRHLRFLQLPTYLIPESNTVIYSFSRRPYPFNFLSMYISSGFDLHARKVYCGSTIGYIFEGYHPSTDFILKLLDQMKSLLLKQIGGQSVENIELPDQIPFQSKGIAYTRGAPSKRGFVELKDNSAASVSRFINFSLSEKCNDYNTIFGAANVNFEGELKLELEQIHLMELH